MILLPAHVHHDLNWDLQIKEAEQTKGAIVWIFDFGPLFRVHDPAFFSSCALAIEEFTKSIWSSFRNRTKGVILYEGNLKFEERLFFSEQTEDTFEDFASEFPDHFERKDLLKLFSANVLSEFLHRLASLLPEEIQGICRLECGLQIDLCQCAQLLCKRRFEHLQLEINEAPWLLSTSKTAVSLPVDERLDSHCREKLNRIFSGLNDFRIIPEELLCEYWDGVDQIIALKEYTGEWGMRMLKGFEATGGEIKISE